MVTQRPQFRGLVELPKTEEPPDIPGKLKIVVKREPYDPNFTVRLPTGTEEYVSSQEAERILRAYGITEPEKILTHVWNFYTAVLYVADPAGITREPKELHGT